MRPPQFPRHPRSDFPTYEVALYLILVRTSCGSCTHTYININITQFISNNDDPDERANVAIKGQN